MLNRNRMIAYHSSLKYIKIGLFLWLILALNLSGVFIFHTFNKIVCIVVLIFVLFSRSWELLHCALLFFLISISSILLSLVKLNVFILYILIPFIISTAIIFPFHPTRRALSWLKVGRIDRISLILLSLTRGVLPMVLVMSE